MALAQFLDRVFDVGKCVAENEISRHAQKFWFPVVFPFAVFVQHRENAEIDGAHVHACHFGAGAYGPHYRLQLHFDLAHKLIECF